MGKLKSGEGKARELGERKNKHGKRRESDELKNKGRGEERGGSEGSTGGLKGN